MQQPLRDQHSIGARKLFDGWFHNNWEHLQSLYYQAIKSQKTGKRWTITIITKLWDVAWDLWDHRNSVFHQKITTSSLIDAATLNNKILHLHTRANAISLATTDRFLLSISLPRLYAFPRIRQLEWIYLTSLALAQSKK